MATPTAAVPVMRANDYRKPDSFVHFMGNRWSDFLKRWNDPNITTDEAKGLLHTVANRLWWANNMREHGKEDSRETCVRFLLHYASQPYRYDNEWQIIEKARKALIHQVLDTPYTRDTAPTALLEDILTYLVGGLAKDRNFYTNEPHRRKIEAFLRMIDKTRRGRKIGKLMYTLIGRL